MALIASSLNDLKISLASREGLPIPGLSMTAQLRRVFLTIPFVIPRVSKVSGAISRIERTVAEERILGFEGMIRVLEEKSTREREYEESVPRSNSIIRRNAKEKEEGRLRTHSKIVRTSSGLFKARPATT